jgi:hypothetical protein
VAHFGPVAEPEYGHYFEVLCKLSMRIDAAKHQIIGRLALKVLCWHL